MDSIIFDVDGTLWDSADSVAAAWNLAIKKFSSLDICRFVKHMLHPDQ